MTGSPDDKKKAHDAMLDLVQRHGMRIAGLPPAEHEAHFELVRISLEEAVGVLALPAAESKKFVDLMMETMRALVREIGSQKGTA